MFALGDLYVLPYYELFWKFYRAVVRDLFVWMHLEMCRKYSSASLGAKPAKHYDSLCVPLHGAFAGEEPVALGMEIVMLLGDQHRSFEGCFRRVSDASPRHGLPAFRVPSGPRDFFDERLYARYQWFIESASFIDMPKFVTGSMFLTGSASRWTLLYGDDWCFFTGYFV